MLLLAEDDPKIAKLIIHLLRKDGYEVDHALDGEEALMYADMNSYEVIILDWMMPVLDGIEACTRLRAKGFEGGILMLTAKDTLDDKIIGLESGSDDYLIKPFEYRELLARIKALLRRSKQGIVSDIFENGEFAIDRAIQMAYYKKEALLLSKKEYQLFALLLENAPNPVPRNMIIDRVWGIDGDISDNNLDVFIRLLRKKIQVVADRKAIINIRGIGYKMEVDDV